MTKVALLTKHPVVNTQYEYNPHTVTHLLEQFLYAVEVILWYGVGFKIHNDLLKANKT